MNQKTKAQETKEQDRLDRKLEIKYQSSSELNLKTMNHDLHKVEHRKETKSVRSFKVITLVKT